MFLRFKHRSFTCYHFLWIARVDSLDLLKYSSAFGLIFSFCIRCSQSAHFLALFVPYAEPHASLFSVQTRHEICLLYTTQILSANKIIAPAASGTAGVWMYTSPVSSPCAADSEHGESTEKEMRVGNQPESRPPHSEEIHSPQGLCKPPPCPPERTSETLNFVHEILLSLFNISLNYPCVKPLARVFSPSTVVVPLFFSRSARRIRQRVVPWRVSYQPKDEYPLAPQNTH